MRVKPGSGKGIVRRCKHCPSSELRPARLRLADAVLLPLGIRRHRCEFCGERQWVWLLPRPLRWGLALLLVLLAYVASTGPVDWLYQNGGLSPRVYSLIDSRFYAPIDRFLGPSKARECAAAGAFQRYREAWATADDVVVSRKVVLPPEQDEGGTADPMSSESEVSSR